MNLNDVHRGIQKNRKRKRIGRGPVAGTGKTAGRGHKGHKSRSGYSRKPNFQGGAMPMFRRVPKRGFNNRWAFDHLRGQRRPASTTHLTMVQKSLWKSLAAKDLAKGTFDEVKILGDGEITKKLTVSAHRFSKSAEEKITAAGGTVNKLPPKRTPKERVEALQADKNKA